MFRETKLIKKLEERNSRFYSTVLNIYEEVESLLNSRIPQVFPTYTQHDVAHSTRIIKHIEKILLDIDELNDLEITLIILSSLLHDIGMAANEDEIKKIEEGNLVYNNLDYNSFLEMFNGNKIEATQDYLRRVHAERSANFIKENFKKKLVIPGMTNKSYSEVLALICKSHTEDIMWVKNNLEKEYVIGEFKIVPQFYAVLLRLGDILDFDGARTPRRLYNAISPSGYSKEEWEQHFDIDNTEKVFEDSRGKKSIHFYGKCSEPKIHRKVLSYLDWVNQEIINAIEITKEFDEFHKIEIHPKVIDNIKSEEYSIVDLKFQMNYKNTIEFLMGESLYGDKKVGLRELIQNSIDACLLLKEIKSRNSESIYEDYHPKIHIIFDGTNNIVRVKDNGIGMSIYSLKRYFLEVGASYYKSQEFLLSGYNYESIGNYGIGFLASFMLSDSLKVRTRDYTDNKLLEVDIFKDNEYVSIKEQENINFHGTEIILNYDQFFDVFESALEVEKYIKENYLIQDFQIIIDVIDGDKIQVTNDKKENKRELNLSRYLDGIDVTLIPPNPLMPSFIEHLSEIKREEISYCFDGIKVIDVKECNIPLGNYLSNNKLKTVSFMGVESSSELYDIIALEEYIDDVEVYYREKHHDEDITIAISPGIEIKKFPTTLIQTDEIVKGLKFEDLEEFDEFYHENSSGTFFYRNELIFFGIEGLNKYLEINSFRSKPNTTDFFVRNVFVENSNLIFDNGLYFAKNRLRFELNISNKQIVPNVARNELLKSDIMLLSNSVQQALYLHMLDEIKDPIEKIIFKGYIKKYHNYQKSLLKDEFKSIINNL
ncbi:histidine kinase/DNA gyrase B/HSP90-like ATPase [Psychrobacillus insolitus]|uniref:Histidine kinase/DNA gyrase B/HSP90-like ATPase n=1 Tax=Psychrobacillus insolitus TaxID=1461 RepID=A0A2W7N620_9BACI|nr:ATP-binding protein [Psychrobacillus insolitus]PZX07413.1 histidine kinase/DNA gyrase B/HSP90-like ATPase [Psychrobacillus insolitus]